MGSKHSPLMARKGCAPRPRARRHLGLQAQSQWQAFLGTKSWGTVQEVLGVREAKGWVGFSGNRLEKPKARFILWKQLEAGLRINVKRLVRTNRFCKSKEDMSEAGSFKIGVV